MTFRLPPDSSIHFPGVFDTLQVPAYLNIHSELIFTTTPSKCTVQAGPADEFTYSLKLVEQHPLVKGIQFLAGDTVICPEGRAGNGYQLLVGGTESVTVKHGTEFSCYSSNGTKEATVKEASRGWWIFPVPSGSLYRFLHKESHIRSGEPSPTLQVHLGSILRYRNLYFSVFIQN